MLFIENQSLDPWFNIAAEEYLLKHFESEIIMIWRSNPSIIVGKHQNTLGEINIDFVKKNQIPVIRRLSGGGTVFHDPGNVNFTFIKRTVKEKLVDFKSHVQPVVDFLKSLNIAAEIGGKNDIRVNGLKISGNAEHIYKDKVLHHGTLLYNADLAWLSDSIKAAEANFESKAVKSLRSTVVNISSLMKEQMEREKFLNMLKQFLIQHHHIKEVYQFDPSDVRAIEKLINEKYRTWEWNFGYSPNYIFRNQGRILNDHISVELKVTRGRISEADVRVNGKSISAIANAMHDVYHNQDIVGKILSDLNFQKYSELPKPWELLRLFF
jgi:lipoate---protein ligase